MSTAVDYLGRTVDVVAFHGAKAVGEVLLAQELADLQGGEYCTGIQKVAQRFAIALLTERGSLPFRPREGCDFLTDLRNGRLRSVTDLYVSFAFAVGAISRQFRETERATDPDEERFRTATLVRAVVNFGSAELHVRVTSMAGDDRAIILPIRTAQI